MRATRECKLQCTNNRLFIRDCSTCRDSRGLITRTYAIRSFPPPPGRRSRACLRRASNQRCTRPTLRNPQDQSIFDSCATVGIVSVGKSRRLCVLCSRIDPLPLANCAASRPDKLRAYKCSIRRRRLIVRASVCFHPDASSTGIIISRTRLRTESISGECGIIPIDSLCRAIVRLYEIYLAGRNAVVQSSEVILKKLIE